MTDISHAEELTAAAQKLQHSADHGDPWVLGSTSQRAIAALLNEVAESVTEDGGIIQDATSDGALALARALLGGVS